MHFSTIFYFFPQCHTPSVTPTVMKILCKHTFIFQLSSYQKKKEYQTLWTCSDDYYGESILCIFLCKLQTVYSIYGIRYFMVLLYVIFVIMMGYTISYTEILSSEQKLAHTLLCFIDQTPDRYQLQLWIFIHHACVFIHYITITIQKYLLCVIQFQCRYVHFSMHYRIQTVTVIQWNSPLWTDLVECYTLYFQCLSIISKSNTLLSLTKTEHISFDPFTFTIIELTDMATYRQNTTVLQPNSLLSTPTLYSPTPQI